MRPFALHSGFYTLVCAHSRLHASLIQGACGSHTRLSQYLLRNVPAINSLIPEPLSCFFAERGRFAKQTIERSDRVCVRNAPRSKHYSLSGVLGGVPLGEGVESNGVRTRGIPPPPLKECFILKHPDFAPKRGFFSLKIVSY